MATHYEHGPGCTQGVNGRPCDQCQRDYPDTKRAAMFGNRREGTKAPTMKPNGQRVSG